MKCNGKYIFEINYNDMYTFLNICKQKNIIIENLNFKNADKKNINKSKRIRKGYDKELNVSNDELPIQNEIGDVIRYEINEEDVSRVIKNLKKKNIKYKILNAKGLSVVVKYFKKHIFLNVVIMLTIFIIYIFSLFIWNVEVTGAINIAESEILKILKENNVAPGKLKSKIDTDEIKNQLHLEFENLSFVSIDIVGTNVFVKVFDYKDNEFEKKMETTPSNIIASKDAIIKDIVVSKGTLMVRKDMMVKKGATLILGKVVYNKDTELEQTKYLKAEGKVLGKTMYDINASKKLVKEVKYYTGRKNIEIMFDDKVIRMPFSKKFSNFEIKEYNYSLLGNDLKVKVISEYKLIKEKMEKEEAKTVLLDELKKKIIENTTKVYDIYDLKEEYFIMNDTLYIKGTVSVLEDICERKYIN